MVRQAASASTVTVHQRYRQLLRAGFSQVEAGSLLAHAAGIDRHSEGETLCGVAWTWQQIARLEFIRYLVATGRLEH